MLSDVRFGAGNSNDRLALVVKGSQVKVIKTIQSDLERANDNAQKQSKFLGYNCGLVSLQACPLKYDYDSNGINKKLLLTMPYIEGIVASEFALLSGAKIAANLALILNEYLTSILGGARETEFPKSLYLMKAASIRKNCPRDFMHFIDLSEQLINDNDGPHLSGQCHGDLTLSNLICESSNKFYLIDFLKCFDETPLQDLSKILQERKYGWSFREMEKPITNRGLIFSQASLPNPYDLLPEKYHKTLRICEIMTLLRIIPYLTDSLTTAWLKSALTKFQRGC